MKRLLVMRHAKSSWSDPTLTDHDRPLNKRGNRDAPRMGRWLEINRAVPESIISSTAVRALNTAALVVEQFTNDCDLTTDENLFHASAGTWKSSVPIYLEDQEIVMVVGHNPGLEHLVYELTGQFESIPTGTIVDIALDITSWRQFGSAHGIISSVWRPREIELE